MQSREILNKEIKWPTLQESTVGTLEDKVDARNPHYRFQPSASKNTQQSTSQFNNRASSKQKKILFVNSLNCWQRSPAVGFSAARSNLGTCEQFAAGFAFFPGCFKRKVFHDKKTYVAKDIRERRGLKFLTISALNVPFSPPARSKYIAYASSHARTAINCTSSSLLTPFFHLRVSHSTSIHFRTTKSS